MIRSFASAIFGGTKPSAPTTSVTPPVTTQNSLSILSKKRKSTDQPGATEEEQTMEYSNMNKPKLLSTTLLHHNNNNNNHSMIDHDTENIPSLANTQRSASTLHAQLKSHASNALMKKPAATTVTSSSTSPIISPVPVPTKEESPSKKQKLNSGAALPMPTQSYPKQPMPPSIATSLAMFQLELDSRIDGLKSKSAFMLSSLERSFKNELNKVPAKVRALTLREFLQSAFEGDAAAVMTEQAMVSQNKLESWVAATPKLRSSRKHREMILATPGHSALLATAQRLTRASAKKLYPNALTGLGAMPAAEPVAAAASSSSSAPAPIQIPHINLADAVFETPSVRGGKSKARVAAAVKESALAPAASPVQPAVQVPAISIASLMTTAARSAKKKAAPATARQAQIDAMVAEVDVPAPAPVKSAKKKAAGSRTARAASPAPEPMEIDSSSAVATNTSASSNDTQDEEYVPEPAPTRKGRAGTKKAAVPIQTKAKATRGRKAAAAVAVDEDVKMENVEVAASAVDTKMIDEPVAPPKKRVARGAAAKKAAAKEVDEDAPVAMEDIVIETPKEEPAAAAPKRVTRARAKKGDDEPSSVSKMLSSLTDQVSAVMGGFKK